MTLLEKQQVFASLLPRLINKARELGYEVTIGEAYRPQAMADLDAKEGKGIKCSLHGERLAIDLNLFKDGEYLTDTRAYQALGMYWESLSHSEYETRWGGFFAKPDGDHFSIMHEGKA